jgi:RNA polymerase sigma-70 factor (ECF subfamily)
MATAMTAKDRPYTLVSRAQSGDRSAFDALVNLYEHRLTALIHSRLGSGLARHVDAEDILQDSLTKAFESLGRFEWDGEESFLRWLGGIAEHRIRDAARRHRAKGVLPLDIDVADSGVSPSRVERRKERRARFEKVLEQLSPDYRQAIVLARIEGLSIEEVARRMNRSPNAVSHLLLRALRKLRTRFGDTESLHLADRGSTPGAGSDEGGVDGS